MSSEQNSNEMLPVIFRKERWESDRKHFNVVAIFPTIPATNSISDLWAYVPVADGWNFPDGYTFGAASYDWYYQTVPISGDEYTPLLNHLSKLEGFENLKVYRRMLYRFLEARRDELGRISEEF